MHTKPLEGFEFDQPDGPWLDRVRKALEAHRQRQTADGAPAGEAEGSTLSGSRLGHYELISELGAGGMGTVWLARRADGLFERKVAIKFIKRGMDTAAVIRRFHTERHLLGALIHPHIARLYDGGSTPDGLPFLVMEHVEGQPILEYCESRGLGVEERLQLFRSVCLAVDHAHRNLILHRDIKPSNILIAADGTPKLLDFGIAKLLDDEAADGAPTATDVQALTPRYASPEQVKGERLTTAADAYSLGVVLYELLTGRPTYELKFGSRAEVERAVLGQEPVSPSVAASQREDLSAAQRSRLSRRLRGALDTIVLTALQKEPSRRYPSAERLAEDIRRHLEGLPPLARRTGAVRRLVHALRRNRVAVVSTVIGSTAALLATAGVLGYWFLAPRWAEEHLRTAHLSLLNPAQGNTVWSATFHRGEGLGRENRPRGDTEALRTALAHYDRALIFHTGDEHTRQERDTVLLALLLAESAGVAPDVPDRLSATAPLTCSYATSWALEGRMPDLTDAQLDVASARDLRCLGLLTMLSLGTTDALRAWSRLGELEADPLIEALMGVLHLSVEQPARAYPRLLSAYRQYPECGFLCVYLADAALDCGDVALAGALLDRARLLAMQDDVLGLDRVQMRYYLAAGEDDKAAALIASKPLLKHNPVAAVQYARHQFSHGDQLEALEVLAYWCVWPVNWGLKFSPYAVNREYVTLTQQWWMGLDQAQRAEVMHRAMSQSASDHRGLFRIMHEYEKCTRRLESVYARQHPLAAGVSLLDCGELGTSMHRELLDWHRRLEISNAHRWWQYASYPPELRRMQVDAWLAPGGGTSADRIQERYESWRREQGLDVASPVTKLLPSPAGAHEPWGDVHLAGDHAMIRSAHSIATFQRTPGGWRREASLAAPPDTTFVRLELDQHRALAVCRTAAAAGGNPARLLTFERDRALSRWVLRSDESLAGAGTAGFASADGILVVAGVGELDGERPGSVMVLRWEEESARWTPVQTIDDWSDQPAGVSFLSPAMSGDVFAVATNCMQEQACDGTVHVFRQDAGTGRWLREAQLVAPKESPDTHWGSIAVERDAIVASRGDSARYDVLVYRHDPTSGRWDLEQRLAERLPPSVRWLGYHSLDIDSDRVTAAAGTEVDFLDWHSDVHVFEYDRRLMTWTWSGTARPADRGFGDLYGQHALSGNTLIVGASGHDAAGINAGAAYIFELPQDLIKKP
jgi:hypothetical protein